MSPFASSPCDVSVFACLPPSPLSPDLIRQHGFAGEYPDDSKNRTAHVSGFLHSIQIACVTGSGPVGGSRKRQSGASDSEGGSLTATVEYPRGKRHNPFKRIQSDL